MECPGGFPPPPPPLLEGPPSGCPSPPGPPPPAGGLPSRGLPQPVPPKPPSGLGGPEDPPNGKSDQLIWPNIAVGCVWVIVTVCDITVDSKGNWVWVLGWILPPKVGIHSAMD